MVLTLSVLRRYCRAWPLTISMGYRSGMPEISHYQLSQLKTYVAEVGDMISRLAGQQPSDPLSRIANLNHRIAGVLDDVGRFSAILATVRQEPRKESSTSE